MGATKWPINNTSHCQASLSLSRNWKSSINQLYKSHSWLPNKGIIREDKERKPGIKPMAVFDGKPVAEAKIRNHQIQSKMDLSSGKPFPKRVKGKKMNTKSITKLEIERYWRNKHMDEEDHLFAAIKAAARVRARNFTEEVYKRFEESLKENKLQDDDRVEYSEESGVGIKDWWTKSKYAYLNQPAVGTPKKKAHSYVPNSCVYKTPAASAGHAATYLGVF